jgi:hypothetical protein
MGKVLSDLGELALGQGHFEPAEQLLAEVRLGEVWLFFAPEIPHSYAVAQEYINVSLIRHNHTFGPGGTTPAADTLQAE